MTTFLGFFYFALILLHDFVLRSNVDLNATELINCDLALFCEFISIKLPVLLKRLSKPRVQIQFKVYRGLQNIDDDRNIQGGLMLSGQHII
jgi:hypothetical protein